MTEQTTVTVSIDSRGVATVTMDNPDKHNAFDDQIIAQLTEAFTALDANPAVRAMVLQGTGKSFSAGADLNWMRRMAAYSYEENLADARKLAHMLHTLNFMTKPTIARVHGAAFGGAVGLVSCCDIAVGSPKANFCLSEVRIGLAPATISPYVVAAIGQRASRRLFQTAERFNADTALRLGLLSEIVSEEALDDAINAQIDMLLGNGPEAMKASKQLVFDVADKPIDEALIQSTSELIAGLRVSTEGQAGLTAFLEKQSPPWKH